MQIYYMKKEKIPIPVSTLVLMIVTIIYKMVLVLIGVILLIIGQGFVKKYLTGILPVFYLGVGLNVMCVTFMLILVFHPVLAKAMMKKGLRLLEGLHILKRKEERMQKLEESMDLYNDTAKYLKRIALFLTTYFVYCAFGLSGKSILDIVLLQVVISIAVDMLPLPGGMGISEQLFLIIFVPIFSPKFLLPGMILSRGLGYYAQLFISAIMTVVAQFTLGKKEMIE